MGRLVTVEKIRPLGDNSVEDPVKGRLRWAMSKDQHVLWPDPTGLQQAIERDGLRFDSHSPLLGA
jgi:hypothetical protein